MSPQRQIAAAIGGALWLGGAAFAQQYSGAGFAIPDNNPVGGSSTIVIGDPGLVGNGVIIGITFGNPPHTWAGDLIATISHSDGVTIATADLFRRIGKTTLGASDFGNSDDLEGEYRFSDLFITPFWAPPSQMPGPTIIPGDFRATTNVFNGSPGAVVSLDSVFASRTLAGTWTLKIGDFAASESGAVTGWTLAIPGPGALALFGMASVLLSRRRR